MSDEVKDENYYDVIGEIEKREVKQEADKKALIQSLKLSKNIPDIVRAIRDGYLGEYRYSFTLSFEECLELLNNIIITDNAAKIIEEAIKQGIIDIDIHPDKISLDAIKLATDLTRKHAPELFKKAEAVRNNQDHIHCPNCNYPIYKAFNFMDFTKVLNKCANTSVDESLTDEEVDGLLNNLNLKHSQDAIDVCNKDLNKI